VHPPYCHSVDVRELGHAILHANQYILVLLASFVGGGAKQYSSPSIFIWIHAYVCYGRSGVQMSSLISSNYQNIQSAPVFAWFELIVQNYYRPPTCFTRTF